MTLLLLPSQLLSYYYNKTEMHTDFALYIVNRAECIKRRSRVVAAAAAALDIRMVA